MSLTIARLVDTNESKVSSTKRGGQRSEADNYPTPKWVVHRLLEDEQAQDQLVGTRWLEPGAGEGSIIRAVNEVRTGIDWTAIELREECRTELIHAVRGGQVIIDDYLIPTEKTPVLETFDVSMGNPPYRLAAPFIDRTLVLAKVVVKLLRVNYLASAQRNSFMRGCTPDVYVLPNRPSFRGTGTDSPEYAWFIWAQSAMRSVGRLRILKTTSLEERKAALSGLPLAGKRERARRSKRDDDKNGNPYDPDTGWL